MSELQSKQLTSAITEIAQKLLSDPEISPIFQKAGKYKLFSKAEEEDVLEFANRSALDCGIGPASRGWDENANIDVAIAVARRVAEGEFTSVDDQDALGLIVGNMVVPNSKVNWSKRTIKFDEYYEILREYMEFPNLRALIDEYWRVCEQYGYDFDATQYSKKAACAPAERILRQYGLISRADFMQVAGMLMNQNINIEDKEAVKECVDKVKSSGVCRNRGEDK